jgi:hypothetical protein
VRRQLLARRSILDLNAAQIFNLDPAPVKQQQESAGPAGRH